MVSHVVYKINRIVPKTGVQNTVSLLQSSTKAVYSRLWQKIVWETDSFVIKTKTAVEKVLNKPDTSSSQTRE